MLCWNVYYGDFNEREIKTYNIFNHWAFYDSCVKAKKKHKDDKEEFAKCVRSNLAYYFWSKCEWEVVLAHWPSGELYRLRTSVNLGKLRSALNDAGIQFPKEDCMSGNERDVTIRVFPNDHVKHERKIDVYEQVVNNWDIFIDYLWEHRKELKARK